MNVEEANPVSRSLPDVTEDQKIMLGRVRCCSLFVVRVMGDGRVSALRSTMSMMEYN